jgi:hypothetical protein
MAKHKKPKRSKTTATWQSTSHEDHPIPYVPHDEHETYLHSDLKEDDYLLLANLEELHSIFQQATATVRDTKRVLELYDYFHHQVYHPTGLARFEHAYLVKTYYLLVDALERSQQAVKEDPVEHTAPEPVPNQEAAHSNQAPKETPADTYTAPEPAQAWTQWNQKPEASTGYNPTPVTITPGCSHQAHSTSTSNILAHQPATSNAEQTQLGTPKAPPPKLDLPSTTSISTIGPTTAPPNMGTTQTLTEVTPEATNSKQGQHPVPPCCTSKGESQASQTQSQAQTTLQVKQAYQILPGPLPDSSSQTRSRRTLQQQQSRRTWQPSSISPKQAQLQGSHYHLPAPPFFTRANSHCATSKGATSP